MTNYISNYNIFEKINNLDIKEVIQRETGIIIPTDKRRPQIKCPFHEERHPSFTTYPETNSWYCFGCGKGGNVFNFVKEYKKLDNKETLWYFKKNYQLEDDNNSLSDYKNISFIEVGLTDEFKRWLKERKLNDETIARFGLTCFKDNDGNHWLGIPIFDEKGKILNYKLRRDPYKEDENLPKYKWLKVGAKQVLYPVNLIDYEKEEIYVVEGELDAILLYQEGFNVLTNTGGGNTKWQKEWIDVLKKFKKVYLIPDRDETGNRWLIQLEEQLKLCPNEVYVIELPYGKDITEFYQQGGNLNNLDTQFIRKIRKGFLTISDLLINFDTLKIQYLPLIGVDGFIVLGWTHIVSAYPKSGKTELLFRNCLEWAKDYKIIYLSEESETIWCQRVSKYKENNVLTDKEIEVINQNLTIKPVLYLSIDELEEFIKNIDSDIIVIDTLRGVAGKDIQDETSASSVSHPLLRIIRLTQERNKTLIILHHTVKQESGIKAIAGSHALAGHFDILITIEPVDHNNRRRIVKAQGRVIPPKEFVYEMDEKNDFKVVDVVNEEMMLIENMIVNLMQENVGKELTTSEILNSLKEDLENEEIKITRNKVKKALNSLKEKQIIKRIPEEEKKGATYRWFIPPEHTDKDNGEDDNENGNNSKIIKKEQDFSILDIPY